MSTDTGAETETETETYQTGGGTEEESKEDTVEAKMTKLKITTSTGSTGEGDSLLTPAPQVANVSDSDSKPDEDNDPQPEANAAPAGASATKAKAMKTMKNTVVLNTIAKILPIRDMFPLRETCPIWNHTFLPQLVNEHKRIVLHTDSSRRPWGDPPPGLLISDFTTAMQAIATSTSVASVASGISFGGYDIRQFGWGPQQDLELFFGNFGNTITRLNLELELDNLDISTFETLRQLIFDWTPELRELSISFDRRTGDLVSAAMQEPLKKEIPKLRELRWATDDSNYPPINDLLEDLCQYAVGLQHLSLQTEQIAQFAEALQIPGGVDPNGMSFPALAHLQSFKVIGLRAQQLRLLIQSGSLRQNPLRLKELNIWVVCDVLEIQGASDSEMVSLIYRFLYTQSTSLCKLRIDVDGSRDSGNRGQIRYGVRLPQMANLYSLELPRDDKWRFLAQCEHGTFATNFPRLKRLEFSFDSLGSFMRRSTEITRVPVVRFAHEGVTSLKFAMEVMFDEDIEEVLAPLRQSLIAKTWPSISKLELELRPNHLELLSLFWTQWPGLVSLSVQLNSSSEFESALELDELLSGVPRSRFAILTRQLGSFDPTSTPEAGLDSLLALRNKFKINPGISDLEQLQEFVFDARPFTLNITDIGGLLGLALMSSQAGIQHMALIHRERTEYPNQEGERMECAGNQISGECRSFLRNLFGPFAVLDL